MLGPPINLGMFAKKTLMTAQVMLVLASLATSSPVFAVTPAGPKCSIIGTKGDDVLTGTPGKDIICGLGGNDLITAGAGEDTIYGGTGDDKIIGGNGADQIFGEDGNDSLVGDSGLDKIDGGMGSDQIFGGDGNDRLNGSDGRDLILGDAGSDTISGGLGQDMVSGGPNRDYITSTDSQDVCSWDRLDKITGKCLFDKTAPKIESLGSSGLSFEAGTTATFRWRTSDASGVEDSWLNIGGPSGWVTKWCGFVVSTKLVDGNSKNGIVEAKCDIPKTAPNLEYSVFLSSRDFMGNVASSSQGISFTVFGGSEDISAPTFELISSPVTIQAGESYDISWRSTDVTDIAYSTIYLVADGYNFGDGSVQYVSNKGFPEKVSGDEKNAIYKMTVKISKDTPATSFTIWAVTADSLGNKKFDKTETVIPATEK